MPGLRKRKQLKRRQRIIEEAARLFNTQGYSATRLDEVAEAAEVGIATVHNYFGTKQGLLAEVLGDEFSRLNSQADALLEQARQDPVEDIVKLIEIYLQLANSWQATDILLQMLGPGLAPSPALDVIATDAEASVKKGMHSILSQHQQTGTIRPDISIDDATQVMFSIFDHQFISFVAGRWGSFSEMKNSMDRLMGFVVESIRTV